MAVENGTTDQIITNQIITGQIVTGRSATAHPYRPEDRPAADAE
jgi:hypothetical protein